MTVPMSDPAPTDIAALIERGHEQAWWMREEKRPVAAKLLDDLATALAARDETIRELEAKLARAEKNHLDVVRRKRRKDDLYHALREQFEAVADVVMPMLPLADSYGDGNVLMKSPISLGALRRARAAIQDKPEGGE